MVTNCFIDFIFHNLYAHFLNITMIINREHVVFQLEGKNKFYDQIKIWNNDLGLNFIFL